MARYNPFAPVKPKVLQKRASRYVHNAIDPQIAELNREYGTRATQQGNAIRDYTNQLAAALANQVPQVQGYYNQALSRQQTLDEGLRQSMEDSTNEITSGLAKQLASLGGTAPQIGEARAIGAGATNAMYAKNSSALSLLNSQAAGAENFAALQPGFARGQGAQQLSNLGAQLENERSNAVGKLQSQVPGMVQDELKQLQNLEMQKSVAQQSGLYKQQQFDLQVAKAKSAARLGQEQVNATLRGQDISHQDRMSVQNALNAYRQAGLKLKGQALDISSKRELDYQRSITLRAKGKKGPYTQMQLDKLHAQAYGGAHNLKHGTPDIKYADGSLKTKGKPPVDPIKALGYLVNQGGIPPSLALQAVRSTWGYDYWKGHPKEAARLGFKPRKPR